MPSNVPSLLDKMFTNNFCHNHNFAIKNKQKGLVGNFYFLKTK